MGRCHKIRVIAATDNGCAGACYILENKPANVNKLPLEELACYTKTSRLP